MAAPDSRHYYEHPNHSAKERSQDSSDYYMSPVRGPVDMLGGAHNGRHLDGEHARPAVGDSSTDSFYRAKLREGFVDLRNSYHQKVNQRVPRPGPTQPQPPNYTSQPALQPRSRPPESTRPLSMHAAGFPAGTGYDGQRDLDYGTTSSRGSADSYHGVSSQQLPPLFRSSSDLHLDVSGNSHAFPDHPLRREFGSADLVEAKHAAGYGHSTDAEFFDMLRSYKADNADQRAPAPPGIHNVLRGESEATSISSQSTPIKQHSTHAQHSQHAPVQGQQLYQPKQSHYGQPQTVPQHKQPCAVSNGPQANSSPPSQQSLEFIKRSPKATRKGQRPRSGDVSALLRKLKPSKGEGDAAGRTESSDSQITGLLTEILPEERLRKKAFVHHDCQSVGINFVEAAVRRQSSQTGNTKTGASAADQLDDQGESNSNISQKPTSLLVCNCKAFVNELGNEEERNVALTYETAQRRVSQAQGGGRNSAVLPSAVHRPAICNGLSILEGLPGSDNRQSLVEKHRGAYVLEYRDRGCTYYRQHFRHSEHQNYFGTDENVGPVAISIKREKVSPTSRLTDPASRYDNSQSSKHNSDSSPTLYQYRVIVRTGELKVLRGVILEDALPTASRLSNSSRGLPAKDIIEYVAPEIQISSLKQATNDEKTKEHVLALDEQGRSDSYKVGIMYCKAGQSTEEEMYNNEHASPAFTQFLDLIGRRVKLSGFDNFRGGLDNKTDTTGTHSYYTTCQAHEIMFHVSTLLPFENNRQQLLRKRHIGNDIVTVVFQEPGSLPFDVTSVRSQFQHVFIVVRAQDPNTERTTYSVAVTRSKDVPSFGPPINQSNYHHGAEFADFLIAKILNAENASYLSDKFQAMAVRTRGAYMKDLATSYVTGNSLDSSSKLGKFSLSVGSGKKKEKKLGKVVPDVLSRGGIVWPTQLEDFGLSTLLDVYLIVSADVIAVMQMDTAEVVFSCWCSSVIGWTNSQSHDAGVGLRIYFNQGDCIHVKPIDNEDTLEIIERLRVVTLGCETREMILRRNDNGQLGFHVHMEGLVSDVDPQGYAHEAGLRTGSRLVEICKVAMVTLTHDQMIDLLRTSSPVSVSVIAPLEGGKPRRSLEEKERSSDYYMLYPTEDKHRTQPNVDGEESSAYFSDDETSPQSTVMSVAKRINTVTLRSSSSGGSSCSPGSTLSGKHQHTDRRLHPDTDQRHHRHVAHSRAKSQDQHYSDTESISQRRPPTGPVYTPPQSQYAAPSIPYYQSTHHNEHSSPPESLHRHRQHGEQRRPTNSNRRAAKDWRHVEPPRHNSSQRPSYANRPAPTDSRVPHSGSQELLAKPAVGKQSDVYSATHGNYSNLDGLHFNRNLHRTFSDESLQSPSRRKSSPHGLYTSSQRKVTQMGGRSRTGSIPLNRDADEDLDWSRLVSTASKAIESGRSSANHYVTLVPWQAEPSNTSRSHDSSTDRDNSSLLSGNSTPTQDKTKDLEARCSRLDHELQMEKRKSKDLERRLQLERNKCDDYQKEVAQLKKENASLRARLV